MSPREPRTRNVKLNNTLKDVLLMWTNLVIVCSFFVALCPSNCYDFSVSKYVFSADIMLKMKKQIQIICIENEVNRGGKVI